MVAVLRKRYFEYDYWKQNDARTFVSASHWVHFARLQPFIEEIFSGLKVEHANELIGIRYREFWRGEFDADIIKVSAVLPYAVQMNKQTMMDRLKEQLQPIRGLLSSLAKLPGQEKKDGDDHKDDQKKDEHAVAAIDSGNVSKHIANYEKMSKGEKLDLAARLSKQASEDKMKNVQLQCMKQAGFVFLSRSLRYVALCALYICLSVYVCACCSVCVFVFACLLAWYVCLSSRLVVVLVGVSVGVVGAIALARQLPCIGVACT